MAVPFAFLNITPQVPVTALKETISWVSTSLIPIQPNSHLLVVSWEVFPYGYFLTASSQSTAVDISIQKLHRQRKSLCSLQVYCSACEMGLLHHTPESLSDLTCSSGPSSLHSTISTAVLHGQDQYKHLLCD